MAFVLKLQITAVLFNLLPLPPLDGFQALAPWLPAETRDRMYAMSNVTFIGLFLVMSYSQPVNHAFWGVVDSISRFLGVPPAWGDFGYATFRFWAN